MNNNPVVHEFKDGEPVGFTLKKMGDHIMSKWLFDHGWQGDWSKLEEPHRNWNAFVTPKGAVLALVKYKNDLPLNSWEYVRDDLL